MTDGTREDVDTGPDATDGGSDRTAAPRAQVELASEEHELLRRLFTEEAHGHLDSMTANILALESQGAETGAALAELLRSTHSLKGAAGTVGFPLLAAAAHALEDRLGELQVDGQIGAPEVVDQLLATVDTFSRLLDQGPDETLGEGGPTSEEPPLQSTNATALAAPVNRGQDSAEGMATGVARPDAGGGVRTATPDTQVALGDGRCQLRAEVAQVDRLLDEVGSLLFERTRIQRQLVEVERVCADIQLARRALRGHPAAATPLAEAAAGDGELPPAGLTALERQLAEMGGRLERCLRALGDEAEALRRSTGVLQDGLAQIRLMPVRWLFARLKRPLREIARREGKRVELRASGLDAQMDRVVAEEVAQALGQLVRNAIVHGIEPPALRLALGKPEAGRIAVTAERKADVVLIEVADDGAGVDVDAVRSALVAGGRLKIAEAEALPAPAIVDLIFTPGLSTRRQADDLSGRGVGLDVVRASIQRLGGELAVRSERDRGTRFLLRLPVTTGISHALLFKVGGQVYALPAEQAAESAEATDSDLLLQQVLLRGERLPLLALGELFATPQPPSAARIPVIIVSTPRCRYALAVDRIIGVREIVVRPLTPLLAPISLFAGTTISGAGKVQLVLDASALAERLPWPAEGTSQP